MSPARMGHGRNPILSGFFSASGGANWGRRIPLLVSGAFLSLGLVPLLTLVGQSFNVSGEFSADRYLAAWSLPKTYALWGHSLALAGLTTLGAVMLGVPLGVLLGKTDLPGRRALVALFTLPLLLPPYFVALGWFALLGRDGWLGRLLPDAMATALAGALFGLPGCVVTLATVFLPLVMLATIAQLHGANPRFEEAARLSAPWPIVLCRITWPAIRPGVRTAALLVFLLALGELGVPMYLRYDVYPLAILTEFAAFYDFAAATAAAAPLALGVAVLLALTGRARAMPDLGRAGTQLAIALGARRPLYATVVFVLLLALVVAPLAALAAHASFADLVAAWRRAGDALGRSLWYAALAASLLAALGVALGLAWRTPARGATATRFLALLLLILPGSVLGIALIGFWNRPATAWFYASPGLLVLGYCLQYAALSGGVIATALRRIPPGQEEAAAGAGAGAWRRLAGIVLPQIRTGIALAFVLCFLFCLRDSGLAMLLYPPGEDTLPVRIYTLMANAPFGLVAACCVCLISTVLLALGFVSARRVMPR